MILNKKKKTGMFNIWVANALSKHVSQHYNRNSGMSPYIDKIIICTYCKKSKEFRDCWYFYLKNTKTLVNNINLCNKINICTCCKKSKESREQRLCQYVYLKRTKNLVNNNNLCKKNNGVPYRRESTCFLRMKETVDMEH